MTSKEFIYETTSSQKKAKFFIIILVFASILSVGYVINTTFSESVTFNNIKEFIVTSITNVTAVGLFFMGFFGSFFFIPIPIDGLFFYGLQKGNGYFISFFLVIVGSMLGNVLNYYIGVKLSSYAMLFISLKKMYAARRWVNKYGYLAIIVFNLTPLPGSILTFALGIARYNAFKTFFWFGVGICLKFGLIIGFHALF